MSKIPCVTAVTLAGAGRRATRAVIIAVALAAATLAATPLAARQTGPAADSAALDSIARAAVDAGFSGQVLVASGGGIVLHRGYGPTDPGVGTPVDTATVFPIGSVTKRFTKAAVLKLAEEGRLALSDPLGRWLPDLPADKHGIPLRHVVDMAAGFHEYHDDTGDHQAMTREEALARIGGQELRFEPGTETAYSNSGYTLLAAVVEEASGMPFEAYVRSALLEPAGMERTGFHGEDRWPDAGVARGYGARRHGDVNAPHRWPRTTWTLMGAGGMVAPASDLLRWVTAVRSGRVLGAEGVADMLPPDRPHVTYAGGDDFGFVTFVMEVDGGEHVVIVQTNSAFRPDGLARELAGAVRGEPLPVPAGPRREVVVTTDDGPGGQAGPGAGPVRGGDSPRARAVSGFLDALRDGSPDALRALVTDGFTPELAAFVPMEEHLRILGDLALRLREADDVRARPVSEFEAEVRLEGPGGTTVVTISVQAAAPHRIEGVGISRG